MRTTSTAEPSFSKSRAQSRRRLSDVDATGQRQYLYLSVSLLVIVVFAVFANTLQNGFVFDDQNHVVRNDVLRSIYNIPQILTASYRPVRDLSYVLDFALWGEQAYGFHLTNVVIHAANSLLVFFLVRRITGFLLTATLAALIFAVHPIQTDSVTYISGRRDILFTLFYLSSFLSYLKYRQGGSRIFYALFLGLWALSLMSKEMAASLPIFIFVWNFCGNWSTGPESYWRRLLQAARAAFAKDKWLYLAIALVIPAYAYYMVYVKGGSVRAGLGGFDYWGGSFYTNMLTAIHVHAWYLKQLVFPTPIIQYLGAFDIATTLADWRVILSIIVVASTIAAGFVLLNRDRVMAFAILSYFVLLLPVSHIIPHHELLADHYLYLPIMSFSLLAALVARKIASRSETIARVAYAAAGVAVVVLAIMTVFRNMDYKDNLTLWQVNYKEVPNSIRAVSSLAGVYANRDPQKAINLYKQSIEIDPSYSPGYVSLAILLQSREKAREVEQIIQRGLALPDSQVVSPGKSDPREFRSELTTALAIARGNQGDNQTAERLLWEAIGLYPTNHQPYTLLASLYRTVDRNKEIEVLSRLIAINPSNTDALRAIASAFVDLKRYNEAVPYLERLLSLDPDDFFANYNLGHIYRARNECERARPYFNTAQQAASKPEEVKAAADALGVLEHLCK